MRSRPAPHRTLRSVAATVALLVLVPLVAATPATAADPVAAAEAEVASMRTTVEQTAATLTAGTLRLEKGQAELAAVQRELAAAEREAEAARGSSDDARTRLSTVAAAAYRKPLPDGVVLALTAGPERFRDAMVAQADLDRVRGSQQDVLREATAERVRADVLVRRADQLAAEADRRTRDLAAQVEQLRATALEAEAKLDAANARLEAAREERRRQQAEAAARAARDRAAAAAAAAASRRAAETAATCNRGATTAGQANGNLDPSALCPLSYAPGHALRGDAAEAFNRMTEAARAERGAPLCVSDSYRSYSSQVSVYARKPGLAAVPGTSNHGWGLAVDLGCGVERFGSDAHRWMQANAGRFGWVHPAWAQRGGSRPEAWHWEFAGS